jgi:Arc/MetJ family transcription regulator
MSGMDATVSLDDELVRTAQEYSGLTDRTALLHEALRALIERQAGRRLLALAGTMPGLKTVRRRRAQK